MSAYAVCTSNELIRHVSKCAPRVQHEWRKEALVTVGEEEGEGGRGAKSEKGCPIALCCLRLLQWLIDLSKEKQHVETGQQCEHFRSRTLACLSSSYWPLAIDYLTSGAGERGMGREVTLHTTFSPPHLARALLCFSSDVTAQWQISVCLAAPSLRLSWGMPQRWWRWNCQTAKWPNGRCRQWGLANWKCAKVQWTRYSSIAR